MIQIFEIAGPSRATSAKSALSYSVSNLSTTSLSIVNGVKKLIGLSDLESSDLSKIDLACLLFLVSFASEINDLERPLSASATKLVCFALLISLLSLASSKLR